MARQFRPEIQGLRALAVTIVVIYHLMPQAVPGGFVGVDVFFVISGYLITGHLAHEAASGRVRLFDFWARRIRRLVPAATVVLASCAVAMVVWVPSPLWERTATQIGASALDIQNWALRGESVDYLAADSSPTLVQHFWSLSVEEQFYIAWPLIIAGVLLIRWGSLRMRLTVALATVAVASFAFGIVETATDPASAYFHTGARAWEFAAGGLLALAGDRLRAPRWVALPGLAAVSASALLFSGSTPFPGYAALLPVLGTVALIAGRGGPRPLLAVLETSPVQRLGDASYSLYLWHWPIIVVVPYATGHALTVGEGLLVLVVSVAFALVSARWIERPVRRARIGLRPTAAFATVAVAALVFTSLTAVSTLRVQSASAAEAVAIAQVDDPCFAARAMANPSCSQPFAVPADLDAAYWADDAGTLRDCNSDADSAEACAFGDTTDYTTTIALVGNSHASHLLPALEQYGADQHWRILLFRKTGCSGILTTAVIPDADEDCIAWSQSVREQILDPANAVAETVLASNNDGSGYFATGPVDDVERAALVSGVAGEITSLRAAGMPVLVIGDVPIDDVSVPECVDLHSSEYDACAMDDTGPDDDLVADAGAQAGAPSLALRDWLCSGGKCHVVIGGALTYIDKHHLTATYSRSLAQPIGDAVAAALP